MALWVRINGADALLRLCCPVPAGAPLGADGGASGAPSAPNTLLTEKYRVFINAHVPSVNALASGQSAEDAVDMYEELGPTRFVDDARFITTPRVTAIQMKPSAMDVIKEAFPDLVTDPWLHEPNEDMIAAAAFHPLRQHLRLDEPPPPLPGGGEGLWACDHKLYLACVSLIATYAVIEQDATLSADVRDAAYHCRVAYVDLFYYCLSQAVPRLDDTFLLSSPPPTAGRGVADQTGGVGELRGMSPYERFYPCDTERVFTADDLPDVWSIVALIPLWGENTTPDLPLARMFSKTLPFSCQRRSLIQSTIKHCEDQAFYRVFSLATWVALAGLYSHHILHPAGGPMLRSSMDQLMRIKQLCSNRTLLVEAFTKQDELAAFNRAAVKDVAWKSAKSQCMKDRDSNCLVLFVVFRLYFLRMAHGQDHYIQVANRCINWDEYCRETAHMAAVLRQSNLFMQDVFSCARPVLERVSSMDTDAGAAGGSSSSGEVYRFRKQSCTMTLANVVNEEFREYIYFAAIDWERDVQLLRRARAALDSGGVGPALDIGRGCVFKDSLAHWACGDGDPADLGPFLDQKLQEAIECRDTLFNEVSPAIKSAILNLLVRLQPLERRSIQAIGALRLDRYGAISERACSVFLRLFDIYRDSSLKQAFQAELEKLNSVELRVAAWYFHVLAELENISFMPLDHGTVSSIHQAMRHVRLGLHPDEPMSPYAFDVVYTLCCGKLVTLQEQDTYGHELIAYDMERELITCAQKKHGRAATVASVLDDEQADEVAEGGGDEDNEDIGDFARLVQAKITNFIRDEFARTEAEHGPQWPATTGTDVDLAGQRRLASDLRKFFVKIPCKDQPVLRIPLRGAMLVLGNSAKCKQYYMRCPKCACFHEFDYTRTVAESGYACRTCAAQDPIRIEYAIVNKIPVMYCEYCRSSNGCTEETRLRVMCTERDPSWPAWTLQMDPRHMIHWVQLCARCFRIGKRYAWTQPKDVLWRTLESKRSLFKTKSRIIRGKQGDDL
jgi:hypothetical protein